MYNRDKGEGSAAMKKLYPERDFVFLDGAGGTMLQQRGLPAGGRPDLMNKTAPETVEAVHRLYVEAGSDIIFTNTFGAGAHALAGTGYSTADIVGAGVAIARRASAGRALVALDIGPLGEMMYPAGSLTFDAAYELFREQAVCGAEAGADLIVIETMSDLAELKAAVLAAKENTDLPIFATMTFNAGGRTYLGCSAESFAITAAALGVDALGVNCALTPGAVLPTLEKIAAVTALPLIMKPNAGLPDGEGHYVLTAEDYARQMAVYAGLGVRYIGGCCGTTPDYIRAVRAAFAELELGARDVPSAEYCCSPYYFVPPMSPGDPGFEETYYQIMLPPDCDGETAARLVTEEQQMTDRPLFILAPNDAAARAAERVAAGVPLVRCSGDWHEVAGISAARPLFTPADILLPKAALDYEKWSVIACDQFTSEPEYWHRVAETVGDAPSTLNFVVPEVFLPVPNGAEGTAAAMEAALRGDVFTEVWDSFILVERTLSDGGRRHGLVGKLDLEDYSFTENRRVRASERTVAERLPERIKIRRAAPLETPHIMVLIDDPDGEIIEAAAKDAARLPLLYDFTLMEGGGHLRGYQIAGEDARAVMDRLAAAERPGLAAVVGDGNHSLAAAKCHWDEVKETLPPEAWESHPARYALVELCNIYSPAMEFLPIHRVVFGAESLPPLPEGETVAEVYEAADEILRPYAEMGCRIDYIHGEDTVARLTAHGGAAGLLMPAVKKAELFQTVLERGVFPKKSFSIGHARDKRYYLECRRITK